MIAMIVVMYNDNNNNNNNIGNWSLVIGHKDGIGLNNMMVRCYGDLSYIWGFSLTIIEDKEDIQDTMGCNADMGLSENSVPLHPMVLLIIIPTKWLFHWGVYPIFRQTHIFYEQDMIWGLSSKNGGCGATVVGNCWWSKVNGMWLFRKITHTQIDMQISTSKKPLW